MKSFYLTDTGKLRDHNEDSVIIVENMNGDYLLAVADGMGGHSAGEVASSIAISCLGKRFHDTFLNMDKMQAVEWIRDSVSEINSLIFKYTEDNPESKGMGTTLVVAIVSKDYILFGNIGDSSGFVIKNDKMYKVTHDHTLVNLLVTAGELTEEEAKHHPRKNVLMKALGINDPIDVDVFDCMDIDAISSIMLCSDGLTSMLSDEQIEKLLLMDDIEVEEKVIRLIRKANNRGGTDNISVAYLVMEDKGSEKE